MLNKYIIYKHKLLYKFSQKSANMLQIYIIYINKYRLEL